MIKVKLLTNFESKELQGCSNATIIKDFYAGLDALIERLGDDDGVYYVKNFPKDLFIRIGENVSCDGLKSLGIKINQDDFFENNIIIKKKDLIKPYVVKPLDTINSICNKFQINKEDLIRCNNLKTDTLFIGQKLYLNI